MILTIIDWIGTIFIIMAAFYNSRKNMTPKNRIKTFGFFTTGCVFILILGCMVSTWGLVTQQVILLFFNIRGLVYGVKEWKKEKRLL